MKKSWIGWATSLSMGMAALAGPAGAQTTGSATATGAARAPAETRAPAATRQQAQAEDKAAQARCNSRKGAEQKTCLEEVRALQQQGLPGGKTGAARKPASPDALPAVQTQSSAVSATGVAPSTTGPDPAPGTPAVPRK